MTKSVFIHDNFLLNNEIARELYHDVARQLPVIDYHNHLPPEDIASNRQFKNLHQIWLAGDHYKWRAMRTCGVNEERITGNESEWGKFYAWARSEEHTSELQSRGHLVCRLLLEKKKQIQLLLMVIRPRKLILSLSRRKTYISA